MLRFSEIDTLSAEPRIKVGSLPRAVIFTALPVEYKAVRNHLKCLEEDVHPQGTIYELGVFSSNDQEWEVGIAEIGEGNEQAALEVERAIQHFNPNIILFVGVAGGVKDDVKIGDVVVANKVYGYESGKAGDTFKTRPAVSLPNYRMINRARAEARKNDWLQRLGELVPDPHPDVFIKPIAAGGKVLNSTRSATYELIKSNYEDTLAVEMEGYGFLKAAYANPNVDALVIRGISDLIDEKEKADKAGYQKTASLNASAFAFEVLAKLCDLENSKKTAQSTSIIQLGEKQIDKDENIENSVDEWDINSLITAFSNARFLPLDRFDPKTPLEMIKQNLVGDRVLPIMAELTRINSIDEQIKYVRERRYAEIYKDSWAEHESQIIGLHVLDVLDLKTKLNLKNEDVGTINIYDAGCANSGQFVSFVAYLKREEINQKQSFNYFAQDFNPDWENKFKVKNGKFILKPLPLIDESMNDLFDVICCTHALHYLGNTPLAIYSSFFSFNYLLKMNGYCYVTVPDKASLPGILDLLEKSANDAGFTIIKSGKSRLIHKLTEEPHNITTFFYLIIQKTDSIDQKKWKNLIGASFHALKNKEISSKYGINEFWQIHEDTKKLKKELSSIMTEKDTYIRVFRYALDTIQNNWQNNNPSIRTCSKNIDYYIHSIHKLMTGNTQQNSDIRLDMLKNECASYFYWLVGFSISYNNGEVNQEHIDILKSTLDSNKDIRVDINNLDDEQVLRLIKHLFEICQRERIDILSAFNKLDFSKCNRVKV